MMMENNTNQRGFLMYISTLFASLALLIGLFILNTSRRELLFSGYTKQSDYAFYAAEAGAECALYWDLIGFNKRTAFPQEPAEGNAHLANVLCGPAWDEDSMGPGFLVPTVVVDGGIAVTSFRFNVKEGGNNYCAQVSVYKFFLNIFGSVRRVTTVSSKGYNVSCDSCCTGSANLLDKFSRRIITTY